MLCGYRIRIQLILGLALLCVSMAHAEKVNVAVAANFTAPMKQIARKFASDTGHKAIINYGSTGKLYAQIINGAPFDVFLSADQARPHLLHKNALADPPITYAIGRLALWSPDRKLVDKQGEVLRQNGFRRLAIANPRTAPYGLGAMQVIKHLGVGESLSHRLVRGENIAQTFQFVMTGNAELGFIALSQVKDDSDGSIWVPPQSLYDPILQDAVLLARGRDNPAASSLIAFLGSDAARRIIANYGYSLAP